jgi:transcriptional regulator with XRE-family HTH domain
MAKYYSVSEMLADSPIDEELRNDTIRRIAEREIIKKLIGCRVASDMSQQEIATHMGCTQSRISKLENGVDADLRLGDVNDYLSALGMNLRLVISDDQHTAAEEIKLHALQIRRRLLEMADLAHADSAMAKGVAALFGEAFFNLLDILQSSADQLPPTDNHSTSIRIESVGNLEELSEEDIALR